MKHQLASPPPNTDVAPGGNDGGPTAMSSTTDSKPGGGFTIFRQREVAAGAVGNAAVHHTLRQIVIVKRKSEYS
ncbi:hypothetical protein L2E82_08104 [Cichorium intybus]|uniref:Uncharacterized protein n=1 Tax=Cichorium intybus TaxID=13427 RepID=A0ACB9G6Q5_CICIN|nr:hypothetical protein L2E82_08104 [Cichorium intybus]